MEQTSNQEKQIVQWKVNNNNWSVEAFLESHPKYKKPDGKDEYHFWPVIFSLADQLGLDENTMHSLFDEKPEYKIADLIFALYLIRLYGTQTWEEFFSYKKTINQGEVHGFIKGHEGLLQSVDASENKPAKENKKNSSADTENEKERPNAKSENVTDSDLKKCLKSLTQILQQHEAARQEYEKAVEKLSDAAGNKLTKNSDQINSDATETERKTAADVSSFWKRIIKLEKENAILKTQLEAEKKEADLKYDNAMEMKKVEISHLKEQLDILINDVAKYRNENQLLKQKEVCIQSDLSEQRKGFLHGSRKRKAHEDSLDARQELAIKIIGSPEYPDFLKSFIQEAYQNGMDLKRMQVFDNPKLEQSNFEMMKAICYIYHQCD